MQQLNTALEKHFSGHSCRPKRAPHSSSSSSSTPQDQTPHTLKDHGRKVSTILSAGLELAVSPRASRARSISDAAGLLSSPQSVNPSSPILSPTKPDPSRSTPSSPQKPKYPSPLITPSGFPKPPPIQRIVPPFRARLPPPLGLSLSSGSESSVPTPVPPLTPPGHKAGLDAEKRRLAQQTRSIREHRARPPPQSPSSRVLAVPRPLPTTSVEKLPRSFPLSAQAYESCVSMQFKWLHTPSRVIRSRQLVSWHPKNTHLAVYFDRRVFVLDKDGGEVGVLKLEDSQDACASLEWSFDGKHLAVLLTNSPNVILWHGASTTWSRLDPLEMVRSARATDTSSVPPLSLTPPAVPLSPSFQYRHSSSVADVHPSKSPIFSIPTLNCSTPSHRPSPTISPIAEGEVHTCRTPPRTGSYLRNNQPPRATPSTSKKKTRSRPRIALQWSPVANLLCIATQEGVLLYSLVDAQTSVLAHETLRNLRSAHTLPKSCLDPQFVVEEDRERGMSVVDLLLVTDRRSLTVMTPKGKTVEQMSLSGSPHCVRVHVSSRTVAVALGKHRDVLLVHRLGTRIHRETQFDREKFGQIVDIVFLEDALVSHLVVAFSNGFLLISHLPKTLHQGCATEEELDLLETQPLDVALCIRPHHRLSHVTYSRKRQTLSTCGENGARIIPLVLPDGSLLVQKPAEMERVKEWCRRGLELCRRRNGWVKEKNACKRNTATEHPCRVVFSPNAHLFCIASSHGSLDVFGVQPSSPSLSAATATASARAQDTGAAASPRGKHRHQSSFGFSRLLSFRRFKENKDKEKSAAIPPATPDRVAVPSTPSKRAPPSAAVSDDDTEDEDDEGLKLEEILEDEKLLVYFERFLHHTLCPENLMFLFAVKKLRDIASDDEFDKRAKEIVTKYVSDGKEQINLSADMSRSIETQANTLTPLPKDLFHEAAESIRGLIAADSVPKFAGSDLYREFLLQSKSKSSSRSFFRKYNSMPLSFS